MKKILLFVLGIGSLLNVNTASAQAFTTQYDTTFTTLAPDVSTIIYNKINNTQDTNITIKWVVISTDFPSDWMPNTGLCDINLCYSSAAIWSGTSGTTYTPSYAPGVGDFHMAITLPSSASNGTHYMTVSLRNQAAGESKTETYVINKWPTAVPTVNGSDDISLYPNPATNNLNILYNENTGIKVAVVYNMIGKAMVVNKVSGNSASINIESVPSGIYLIRLFNADGNVVATRKFTKQ